MFECDDAIRVRGLDSNLAFTSCLTSEVTPPVNWKMKQACLSCEGHLHQLSKKRWLVTGVSPAVKSKHECKSQKIQVQILML